jgi:hypothetical protein
MLVFLLLPHLRSHSTDFLLLLLTPLAWMWSRQHNREETPFASSAEDLFAFSLCSSLFCVFYPPSSCFLKILPDSFLSSRCASRGSYVFLDYLLKNSWFAQANHIPHNPGGLGSQHLAFSVLRCLKRHERLNTNLAKQLTDAWQCLSGFRGAQSSQRGDLFHTV